MAPSTPSTPNTFGLDDLSKIQGAESSETIATFFKTLDTYITDEDLAQFEKAQHLLALQSVSSLREDVVRESSGGLVDTMIANFPAKKGRAIEVPKIIE
jgi:Asp-tRNA(Asn)/Glu-tRNA(Gln) amidotransferase C subunit